MNSKDAVEPDDNAALKRVQAQRSRLVSRPRARCQGGARVEPLAISQTFALFLRISRAVCPAPLKRAPMRRSANVVALVPERLILRRLGSMTDGRAVRWLF